MVKVLGFLSAVFATVFGVWGVSVVLLSLERAAPQSMPAASPIYESRAALSRLSYPLDCDATVTQLGKTRCYARKEAK